MNTLGRTLGEISFTQDFATGFGFLVLRARLLFLWLQLLSFSLALLDENLSDSSPKSSSLVESIEINIKNPRNFLNIQSDMVQTEPKELKNSFSTS